MAIQASLQHLAQTRHQCRCLAISNQLKDITPQRCIQQHRSTGRALEFSRIRQCMDRLERMEQQWPKEPAAFPISSQAEQIQLSRAS